jgi:hypothetical protein
MSFYVNKKIAIIGKQPEQIELGSCKCKCGTFCYVSLRNNGCLIYDYCCKGCEASEEHTDECMNGAAYIQDNYDGSPVFHYRVIDENGRKCTFRKER